MMVRSTRLQVFSLAAALALLLCCRAYDGNSSAAAATVPSSQKKIAFLFLTRGHMPLEDVWWEFFTWRADPALYSIYAHPAPGFRYPNGSLFSGREIANRTLVTWGGFSQAMATRNLLSAALRDPLNEWFCLMSESCIPLLSFGRWRRILLANTKSIYNACPMADEREMEGETRWRPSLDKTSFKKEHWRKSANWFAVTRRHAQVMAAPQAHEWAWKDVPCADEHYFPSVLASYGMDNETTCSDGFIHAYWPSLIASHPHVYRTDQINEELFSRVLQKSAHDLGGAGGQFSAKCSGFKEVCHFTARKFSGASKYALLEHIDMILQDDEARYDGDPFTRHRSRYVPGPYQAQALVLTLTRLRADRSGSAASAYFVIEGGFLREVPDAETLRHLHLSPEHSSALTAEERRSYPRGAPFPSRRDGQFVKVHKRVAVFLLRNGTRHEIPDIRTFHALGGDFGSVKGLGEHDIEQIPLGEPIPRSGRQ